MKTTALISALVLSIGAQAQDGLIRKSIQPFNSLIVNGDVKVYIKQNTENTLSASVDAFKEANFTQTGNELVINGGDGTFYLNTTGFSSLLVNGSADAISSDTLRAGRFEIKTNGNADASLILVSDTVDVSTSGASDVRLAGRGVFLKGRISGAGDIKATRFLVDHADISISGAGDAKVNAASKVTGAVSGAGTLYHVGTPAMIDVSVSGAGEVKKANDIDGQASRITFGDREIIIMEKEGKDSTKEIGDDFLKGFEDGFKNSGKKKKKRPTSIWSGFELGVNGWFNGSNGFDMDSVNSDYRLNYGKSIVVNFNLWEKSARLIGNNVFVTTGLGAEINNYRFDRNVRMLANSEPLQLAIDDSINYKKSKFTIGYLNAPLYLTFATNPIRKGKRLFISPGITGGWKFTSYNKRKVEVAGDESKSRTRNDFNLNPFRVNASLRLGYGSFVLFANYSLTDLFLKNEGPNLIPFSVGVRVIGFGG